MKTCYVMVGLPGLGKSTEVEKMVKMDPDAYVYSTDNILEHTAEQLGKTYDEVFADHIKSAQTEADIWLADAMKNGQDIIWDQTNTGVKKRKRIIDKMKRAGYEVECICICPPEAGHLSDLKDWKWRLQNRPGKTIPDHVMKSMFDSYVEPNTSEGFKKVTYYSMYGHLLGIDYMGL